MAFLKKVDHITYACAAGTIEKWAWFHIEIEGGVLINRIDDVRPDDPDSSMKIWCIDYGEFGIALIEGIDRRRQSQVTRFVEHNGDHSCQHVAYDCHDLDAFRAHLIKSGCHPRGQTLVRNDGFGVLKQMFAKGYEAGDPTTSGFPEYVQRPRHDDDALTITFSESAGRGFYDQIENAVASGDVEPFVDFSKMPRDWRVPAPVARSDTTRNAPSAPSHSPTREPRARR
jgi:hypothetical protein